MPPDPGTSRLRNSTNSASRWWLNNTPTRRHGRLPTQGWGKHGSQGMRATSSNPHVDMPSISTQAVRVHPGWHMIDPIEDICRKLRDLQLDEASLSQQPHFGTHNFEPIRCTSTTRSVVWPYTSCFEEWGRRDGPKPEPFKRVYEPQQVKS